MLYALYELELGLLPHSHTETHLSTQEASSCTSFVAAATKGAQTIEAVAIVSHLLLAACCIEISC